MWIDEQSSATRGTSGAAAPRVTRTERGVGPPRESVSGGPAGRSPPAKSMSFHPSMDYGRGHHQSARAVPELGPAFVYTADNQAKLEEICARYPPEERKSAILAALYLAQKQQGYITQNAMAHVAEAIRCTPAEVEDVV